MSERAFYELEGVRQGGVFTVEILGKIDLAEAVSMARYYADLWASRVRLYRVPYLNTSSTPWAADEKVLIDDFTGAPPNTVEGSRKPYVRRSFYELEEMAAAGLTRPAYELYETYIDEDGRLCEAPFSGFEADSAAAAIAMVRERCTNCGRGRLLSQVVKLYGVPFYHEGLRPWEAHEKWLVCDVDLGADFKPLSSRP
jgi:hypothetical protein